jgi:hypothetical protein
MLSRDGRELCPSGYPVKAGAKGAVMAHARLPPEDRASSATRPLEKLGGFAVQETVGALTFFRSNRGHCVFGGRE